MGCRGEKYVCSLGPPWRIPLPAPRGFTCMHSHDCEVWKPSTTGTGQACEVSMTLENGVFSALRRKYVLLRPAMKRRQENCLILVWTKKKKQRRRQEHCF